MADIQSIRTILEVALASVHLGRPGEARIAFDGLLEYDPNLTAAKIGRALSYAVVNEFDESERLFLDILKDEPDNTEALAFLGLLYKLSKNSKANAVLEKAKNGPGKELAEAVSTIPE